MPDNKQDSPLEVVQETLNGACEIVNSAYAGNFEKAELTELKGKDKSDILSMAGSFRYSAVAEAVPPQQDDKIIHLGIHKFQRLMQGRRFMAVIMFHPLDQSLKTQINNDLQEFSNNIEILTSQTRIYQEAKAKASSGSVNNNKLNSLTKTVNNSIEKEGTTTNHSIIKLNSIGCTLNSCFTLTDTSTVLVSQNISILSAVDWQRYVKNVIFERYQYGRDKGLFQYTVNFSVDDMETLHILECAWKNLFQSRKACKVPLKCTIIKPQSCLDNCFK